MSEPFLPKSECSKLVEDSEIECDSIGFGGVSKPLIPVSTSGGHIGIKPTGSKSSGSDTVAKFGISSETYSEIESDFILGDVSLNCESRVPIPGSNIWERFGESEILEKNAKTSDIVFGASGISRRDIGINNIDIDLKVSGSNKEVSTLLHEINEILKLIPTNAQEICHSYSDIGLRLFSKFYYIGLKHIDRDNQIQEVNKAIEFFIQEHFDWLETLLFRFPFLYLNGEYELERVNILRSGIEFVLNRIDKSQVKTLLDKVEIIDDYLSRESEDWEFTASS